MNKKRTKIIAIILAVISVISIIGPILSMAAVNVEDKPDFNDYDIHRHADLIDLKWYNAMVGGFGSMFSSKNVSYTSLFTGIDTSYTDKNGVVYSIKTVNDNTAYITGISTPVGMDTVVIPEVVTIYRLVKVGEKKSEDISDFKGQLYAENENINLWYDFTAEYDTEKQTGPNVTDFSHNYQIIGVNKAFANNVTRVKTVILPELITEISANAFENNHYIKNIYAPGVTEVRDNAFYDCNELCYAEFPAVRYVENKAFYRCNKLLDFNFASIIRIGSQSFYDCVKFKEVTLRAGLNALGSGAFENCTGVTNVIIEPEVSINAISSNCFKNCTSLRQISIPKEIIRIEASAFYGCASLIEMNFPENLDTIASKAFWGCISLDYIVLPAKLVTFSADAFDNCTSLRFVYFTKDLTDTQVAQIKKSSIGNCAILPKENMGVMLWNKTNNTSAGKDITVYEPTDFEVYDTVDIKDVTVTPFVSVVTGMSGEHKSYVTRTGTFTINVPGKYTVDVTDMFGKTEVLTVEYKLVSKYTVKFDGNGATKGQIDDMSCVIGQKFTLPANPYTKETKVTFVYQNGTDKQTVTTQKNVFNGWATTKNGSNVYDAETEVYDLSVVNGDEITLYAIWTASPVSFPSVVFDNHVFAGWNTKADGSGEYVTSDKKFNTAEVTLYAIWTPVKYTVSFDKNGATGGIMQNIEAEYDKSFTLPECKYEKKFTVSFNDNDIVTNKIVDAKFLGWSDVRTGVVKYGNKENVMNLTGKNIVFPLYAIWEKANIELPTPKKVGHEFLGWYTDKTRGVKVGDSTNMIDVTKDVTYYARWHRMFIEGDVTLDNQVTPADARLVLRYVVGLEKLNETQKYQADYNYSGSITAADARLVMRQAVGLDK